MRALAQPVLDPAHLEFDGGIYQDYKGMRAQTIHGKGVKLLRLRSFRMPAFDAAAAALSDSHKGRPCVSGQDNPEPAASRCKAFRAYNPSLVALGRGEGVLVAARLSNWSLCSWSGRGRPYADWPERKWPEAVFEEYHSHVASLALADAELAGAGLAAAAGPGAAPAAAPVARLVALDAGAWSRTRAPFFEIFRQGVEDPRLLLSDGRPRALVAYGERAARREPTRLADARVEGVGAFRQALMVLHGAPGGEAPFAVGAEDFAPLHTDFDRHAQQKNWMPFLHKGALHAVYQLVPSMKVLSLDGASGSATAVHETEAEAALSGLRQADVRGGSQCVHLLDEEMYLGVAHVSRGRGMYTHFFFAFADMPPFRMLGVSREWCFAHEETFQSGKELLCEGVQFVSGLALLPPTDSADNSSLLMSYGVMDCDGRIARISVQSALKSIKFSRGQSRRGAASGAEL